MKPIKCKHFYVPSMTSKVLNNMGYCKETNKKCILVLKKGIGCTKKKND